MPRISVASEINGASPLHHRAQQLLHRLALRRYQFIYLVVLCRRVGFPVVPAHAVSRVVHEV
jgi:hypothetical protein